jgi:hypothetical protein
MNEYRFTIVFADSEQQRHVVFGFTCEEAADALLDSYRMPDGSLEGIIPTIKGIVRTDHNNYG